MRIIGVVKFYGIPPFVLPQSAAACTGPDRSSVHVCKLQICQFQHRMESSRGNERRDTKTTVEKIREANNCTRVLKIKLDTNIKSREGEEFS